MLSNKYGKTVVIVSQCRTGFVRSSYASCEELKKMGAILAEDMTIEAVIAKLSYVLGKGYKREQIRNQLLTDLRGEITVEQDVTVPESIETDSNIMDSAKLKEIEAKTDIGSIGKDSNVELAFALCQKAYENDHLSIRLFHQMGANLNIRDYDNRTMTHVAAARKSTDVLYYLAKHTNADFYAKDSHGFTPLDEITEDEEVKNKILEILESKNVAGSS